MVIVVELEEVLTVDVKLADLERELVPVPPVKVILVEVEDALVVEVILADVEGDRVLEEPVTTDVVSES